MWIPSHHSAEFRMRPGENSYALRLHPQPRLYKTYWQVWSAECPWEGVEFFHNAPLLCTADFLEVRAKLLESNTPFAVYNKQYPREGGPFDKTSSRWAAAVFAPAYDDDPDPITQDGHR